MTVNRTKEIEISVDETEKDNSQVRTVAQCKLPLVVRI
jgi:hypothetical protein